jgi:FkbM family methyltransferase
MKKEEIKILLNKNNPVILEIGTNDGEDSEQFLKCFENISLYCFEPDPRAILKFKNRMKNYKNYSLYEIAISNTNGFIDFYLSGGMNPGTPYYGDWDKSSSIKKPKLHLVQHQWCKFPKSIKIETKKLDDWCKEQNINFIDFIWVDVQGAEKEFIEGAKDTLEKTKYLYTEFDNVELYEGQINLDTILKMLPNFKVVKFVQNNVLLKNDKV